MLPANSCNWVNHTKKVQAKYLAKKSMSIETKSKQKQPEKAFESQMNGRIVDASDIKEYYYSMKNYLVIGLIRRASTKRKYRGNEN